MEENVMRLSRIPLLLCAVALAPATVMASSHREAPMIAGMPRVDGSDFYMFNSYETGRGSFVPLIANYVPLPDAYGGPNYFQLDPSALYEFHLANSRNPAAHLTDRKHAGG